MGFPQRLLVPGEEVVLEAYPSRSVLLRPFLTTLVVLAAVGASLVEWSAAPLAVVALLGAVTLSALLFLAGRVVSWRSRLFVITTERVIARSGVVRRTGREIPLERVAEVVYHQSLVERLLRIGSVIVEPAGSGDPLPAFDLRRPAEIQSLINQLAAFPFRRGGAAELRPAASTGGRPRRADRRDVTAPMVPVGGGGALGDSLRDLERLHERGVLSDDEFDSKRRQLLGVD